MRNRGIDTVVLGGLVANLCVDSHMRAPRENGFRVYVVKDAVAAPGAEAYKAALVNYGMIANAVLRTDEALRELSRQAFEAPIDTSEGGAPWRLSSKPPSRRFHERHKDHRQDPDNVQMARQILSDKLQFLPKKMLTDGND